MIDFVKNEFETEFRIKIKYDVLGIEKINVKKNKYFEPKCGVPTACELLNANNSKSSSNFCENSNNFKKYDCILCEKSHMSENYKDDIFNEFGL